MAESDLAKEMRLFFTAKILATLAESIVPKYL